MLCHYRSDLEAEMKEELDWEIRELNSLCLSLPKSWHIRFLWLNFLWKICTNIRVHICVAR